jgi:hypothetical protein
MAQHRLHSENPNTEKRVRDRKKQGKIHGKAFTIRSGAVERGFIGGMPAGTG